MLNKKIVKNVMKRKFGGDKMDKKDWLIVFQFLVILIMMIVVLMYHGSLETFMQGVTYLDLRMLGNWLIIIGLGAYLLIGITWAIVWQRLLS